jgi:uncharacterized membrane protein YwzB
VESLILEIIVCVLLFGVLFWAISLLPIPAPYGKIAQALLALLLVIIILTRFLHVSSVGVR